MRLAELAKAEHAPPTDESEKSQNEKMLTLFAVILAIGLGHHCRGQEIWRRQILWQEL